MTSTTTKLARTALGAVAAAALAIGSAAPALADDRRERDGIGAGEVIAGALVIGGIAALAGAFDGNDRRDWRDRRHRDWRGDRRGFRGDPQRAINRCIRAAENQARRFGGWRFAQATDIRDVDRTRYGFRVQGRIEVRQNVRFRDRFDRGRFTCRLDGRGAPHIDFAGVRGLR
ncbi:hypothetical protein [Erythrobacter sp. HL-111]|uniref:hypothetical protein n=1 Tax=Erythrobacter sp. HL-111 TaxID=1798193 RepID=UPI0006DA9668|nr:hypothetical protein [Erythrobacter sp. HL-111]KPP94952.1 MAG: hypothetical protein HLUCCO15_02610 [Erythrobacteraceae bacterium HL-111]SDS15252.1 hypothetical protein SAMN04515621_1048 [Erythrobacter sp. HL-111]